MKLKTLAIAAGALLLSAGVAAAATAETDLNMRSGPGTSYRVINTIPAGGDVDVLGCSGAWCRVNWQGSVGYASASYLGGGGGYTAAPVYVAPPVVYGFGWGGPRWYGHRGWGGGYRGGYRGGWHGGYRSGGRGGWHGGGHHGGHRR
ncbi:MAG: SH3 domain-containing protein [Pseudolabrys sp.]|jgi:uncharacterized protein YraI